MKDHNGNGLVVGDWVRVRNDKQHTAVQITKIVHGQVVLREYISGNRYRGGSLTPRCSRALVKLEPEELI